MTESPDRTRLEPVHKTVTVSLAPEAAFRRFTAEIASWWPLETHSVGEGQAESVVFEGREGGQLYERLRDGSTSLWGTVRVYEPPRRVVFTWHPGREPDAAQEVEVRFSPDAMGTRVDLLHRGWEILGERADEMRSDYDRGWDFVLGRYVG